MFSVTCKLLPPTIVANDDEFILEKNSVFNISCTGKKKVAWVEPLPDNTFVYPGYYTATLFIYNASGAHTRYYTCRYQTIDAETAANHEDENETEIHVFVPGRACWIMVQFSCSVNVVLAVKKTIWD